MNNFKPLIVVFILIGLSLSLTSCDILEILGIRKNRPPTIVSLTANPTSVSIRGTSTVTCNANDPDGDPLTYIWQASGGIISGSGAIVTWTAPSVTGTYSVIVTVSDGRGGEDKRGVNIDVIQPRSNVDFWVY